jgi:hypothetical protein
MSQTFFCERCEERFDVAELSGLYSGLCVRCGETAVSEDMEEITQVFQRQSKDLLQLARDSRDQTKQAQEVAEQATQGQSEAVTLLEDATAQLRERADASAHGSLSSNDSK